MHVRRKFLRNSVGVSLALPMLESLASPVDEEAADAGESKAKRLVCVGTYLGFHREAFFPTESGRRYTTPTVLKPIESFRDDFTILSGLDHRGRNGHEGWKAWMTGVASGSVSMDQLVADKIGHRTRFSSLQVTCGNPPSSAKLSFTREGVALPMIGRPSVLFRTLFRSGSDRARLENLLASNHSVLDGAIEEAGAMQRQVNAADRRKLDQYLDSVRDVEAKLQKQRLWLDKPVPKVDYTLPEFDPVAPALALECESIMYDLMALALTTDSSRVLTFLIPGWSQVFTIEGRTLNAGYHGLSHHGNDPAKIAEYNLVGMAHVQRFAKFLEQLQSATDAWNRPLLDSTIVVYGSGMGDSNTHDNSNLPTLVAGGGFRHGQHCAIDPNAEGARRLGDLYLTVMNQFGVEATEFAGARHNLNESLL